MTRSVLLTASICILLLGSLTAFVWSTNAQTQSRTPPPSSGTPANQPAATQNGEPALQCQGCHGTGKTLPYLGGALFHAQVHADYDHGFHAQGVRNGAKAATCRDCHTRNGDLTTILPATDPKSTINRSNIAETAAVVMATSP